MSSQPLRAPCEGTLRACFASTDKILKTIRTITTEHWELQKGPVELKGLIYTPIEITNGADTEMSKKM